MQGVVTIVVELETGTEAGVEVSFPRSSDIQAFSLGREVVLSSSVLERCSHSQVAFVLAHEISHHGTHPPTSPAPAPLDSPGPPRRGSVLAARGGRSSRSCACLGEQEQEHQAAPCAGLAPAEASEAPDDQPLVTPAMPPISPAHSSFSRRAGELEADALGLKIMENAGYDSEQLNTFWELLQPMGERCLLLTYLLLPSPTSTTSLPQPALVV